MRSGLAPRLVFAVAVVVMVGVFLSVASHELGWSQTTTFVVGAAMVVIVSMIGTPLMLLPAELRRAYEAQAADLAQHLQRSAAADLEDHRQAQASELAKHLQLSATVLEDHHRDPRHVLPTISPTDQARGLILLDEYVHNVEYPHVISRAVEQLPSHWEADTIHHLIGTEVLGDYPKFDLVIDADDPDDDADHEGKIGIFLTSRARRSEIASNDSRSWPRDYSFIDVVADAK